MKIKLDKRKICISITALAISLMLIFELLKLLGFSIDVGDAKINASIEVAVVRLLGSAVFITLIFYFGYNILNPKGKSFWRSLAFSLPGFAVALNNLPIYPLLSGMAEINAAPLAIAALALECFSVGLFEETCFRGFVFLGFLKKKKGSKMGEFMAIVLSSAVFGIVHLINIALGSSPIAVILQIGYSFLIGAMCSLVLIKSANIWLCVALHSLFNFCGAVVPNCGGGIIWEGVTITLTVLVALAATAYFVISFVKSDTADVERIFNTKTSL